MWTSVRYKLVMTMAKLTVAVFLLLISAQTGQQPQCSVDNLPEFGTTLYRTTPASDRFQAIVPAYTFQCAGRVTEWSACVWPGLPNEQYYIQFQVWRPTANGIEGCYELVDYNIPLDDARQEEMDVSDSPSIIEAEGFLSLLGNLSDPLSYCVVLPVRENQQIEFQPGDVVGYYVDYFRNGVNRDDGGIQWIRSTAVTVYFTSGIPRVDIKTQYALSPLVPSSCGFQVSDETSSSHILRRTSTFAPIISLTFTTMMLASTVAPMLTPTPSPPQPVVTSTHTLPPPGPAVTSFTLTTTSVTLLSFMTTLPEMSPPVPPPATPPRVSNITILWSVLAIIIVAIAVFTVATVVISVLVCLKKRKRETELVDNVAYHSHNMELQTSPNSAYNAVSTAIPTTTNEAYAATRIPTSPDPNTAYEVVQATADDRDIDTKTNEAYVSTGIATSVNEAYQPVQSASDNTPLYDYARPQ